MRYIIAALLIACGCGMAVASPSVCLGKIVALDYRAVSFAPDYWIVQLDNGSVIKIRSSWWLEEQLRIGGYLWQDPAFRTYEVKAQGTKEAP